MKKIEIRFRCWIYVDGTRFFGPGRAELLELILETGSLAAAAKSMGMSYKKAWDMVEQLNSRGKKPYVIARKGGKEGGGSEITAAGKKVLNSYQKFNKRLTTLVNKEKGVLSLIRNP